MLGGEGVGWGGGGTKMVCSLCVFLCRFLLSPHNELYMENCCIGTIQTFIILLHPERLWVAERDNNAPIKTERGTLKRRARSRGG